MKRRLLRLNGFAFLASTLLLLCPAGMDGQTRRDLAPDVQGFGTQEAPLTVDLSKLTTNTALDSTPTTSWPIRMNCDARERHDGPCHYMNTDDQRRMGKVTPRDLYPPYVSDYRRRELLREGFTFFRFPHVLIGREQPLASPPHPVRFVWYNSPGADNTLAGGIAVWYRREADSFYIWSPYTGGVDVMFGPFKGHPLVQLRKAIKPRHKRTMSGVNITIVSHQWVHPTMPRPSENPPPESPVIRNYSELGSWMDAWRQYGRARVDVRLTNNTERALYYVSGASGFWTIENLPMMDGLTPWHLPPLPAESTWARLEPGQWVEAHIEVKGVGPRKYLEHRSRAIAPQQFVAFVNTEPVFWDEIPIEISVLPPFRD
jgi:hypothetical protein